MIKPQEVHDILGEVLSEQGALVEGIMATFGIAVDKLEKHRETVRGWVGELPITFFPTAEGGGDGWSFLQMCQTRDGDLWTGEHRTMEALMVLAFALGLGKFLLPRALWSALPGGMPYIIFTLEEQPATA